MAKVIIGLAAAGITGGGSVALAETAQNRSSSALLALQIQSEARSVAAAEKAADAAHSAALAAWSQAGLAALGVLVASIGTVFLVRTFRATQMAAKAARDGVEEARKASEANLAALRPWIRASITDPSRIEDLGDQWQFTLQIRYENLGQSPALRAKMTAAVVLQEDINFGAADEPARQRLTKMLEQMAARPGADRTHVLFPQNGFSIGHGFQIQKAAFREMQRLHRGSVCLIGSVLVAYEFQGRQAEAIHQFLLTPPNGIHFTEALFAAGEIRIYGGQDVTDDWKTKGDAAAVR